MTFKKKLLFRIMNLESSRKKNLHIICDNTLDFTIIRENITNDTRKSHRGDKTIGLEDVTIKFVK